MNTPARRKMELIEYSLLRLIAAAFIPFTLFVISSTSRRPGLFERYSWAVLAIGVVSLTWLLTGYLNQNTSLLVFMYPLFVGFIALIGPSFYFGVTGTAPWNVGTAILHGSPALFLFTSALISTTRYPIYQTDFEHLFSEGGLISEMAWSLLGDQRLPVMITPIHFGAYAASAYLKTREKEHLLLILPLFLMTLLFAIIFSTGGTYIWRFKFLFGIIELALLIIYIRFILNDSPRVQFERKKNLKIIVPLNQKVQDFLSNEQEVRMIFIQPKISLAKLSELSDIDITEWRNYFAEQDITFTDLKREHRITHAIQLINEGYLNNYTVDSLAAAIGYSSRTSFYSAYKQITGRAWERDDD